MRHGHRRRRRNRTLTGYVHWRGRWRRPVPHFRVLTTFSLLEFFSRVVMIGSVIVLAWVRDFVLEDLDELVEDDGQDGADARSNPVDPVVVVKDTGYDTGTERTCGVQ